MGFRKVLGGVCVSEGYWGCHKVLGAQAGGGRGPRVSRRVFEGAGGGGSLSVFMSSRGCSRVSRGSRGRLRVLEGWNLSELGAQVGAGVC